MKKFVTNCYVDHGSKINFKSQALEIFFITHWIIAVIKKIQQHLEDIPSQCEEKKIFY